MNSDAHNSGLPHDYFAPRRRVPTVVLLVICAGILAGVLAVVLGGWL